MHAFKTNSNQRIKFCKNWYLTKKPFKKQINMDELDAVQDLLIDQYIKNNLLFL